VAITAQQVETALASSIKQLPLSDAGPTPCIVLATDDEGSPTYFVDVPTFLDLFGAASGMTAEALSAIDGGKMGYGTFIATWQAAGYIPAS